MPFFQRPLSKDLNNKRSVTLQVRIPLELRGLPGKRVLSSASIRSLWCVRPLDCLRMGASITVEAALALPLFLFAVMILMMPMVLMNESRKIQSELELVCAEISQYAGVLSDSALERGDGRKDQKQNPHGEGRPFFVDGLQDSGRWRNHRLNSPL